MTDDDSGSAATKVRDKAVSVCDEPRKAVCHDGLRLVGQIAAATIRRDDGEPV
jgi:hypothetical protein